MRSSWPSSYCSQLTCLRTADIEVDGEIVPYAIAGMNATIYLAAIDPINFSVGCVLCSPKFPVSLASIFRAQIVTFEHKIPLIAGSAVR